jgi:endonuclease/exonuclease/phosphatase family metal-dependent hydrolase
MRFLLYNMRYGTGAGPHFHLPFPGAGYLKDTRANLGRIADFIVGHEPDVVGLCEVDSGSLRSPGTHQAEVLAQRLGHGWHFRCKYRERSWLARAPLFRTQGNALLARHGATAQFHDLGHGVKRLAIGLELEQAQVYLVHLALGRAARHRQLEAIGALVAAATKPVIVAGDLNTFAGAEELEAFRRATRLRSANALGAHSYPSHRPRLELDWILYGPGLSLERFHMPVVKWSDHLPLIADFRVH